MCLEHHAGLAVFWDGEHIDTTIGKEPVQLLLAVSRQCIEQSALINARACGVLERLA